MEDENIKRIKHLMEHNLGEGVESDEKVSKIIEELVGKKRIEYLLKRYRVRGARDWKIFNDVIEGAIKVLKENIPYS